MAPGGADSGFGNEPGVELPELVGVVDLLLSTGVFDFVSFCESLLDLKDGVDELEEFDKLE